MSFSLEQVENRFPQFASDDLQLSLVCNRLRQKPIDTLTIEDLRILIGQNIGLEHILPLALHILERNPMASGLLFDGDLLYAVVHCAHARQPGMKERIAALCRRAVQSCRSRKRVDLMKACFLNGRFQRLADAETEFAKSVRRELATMPWDSFVHHCSRAA